MLFRSVNSALAEATDTINNFQIQRLLAAVEAQANPGATIAVLGMSYKPMTGVVEESQGVELAGELAKAHFNVVVSDPLALPAAQAVLSAAQSISFEADPLKAIAAADVIVFTTAWPEYKEIPVEAFAQGDKRRIVIDPWSLFDIEAIALAADLVKSGLGSTMIKQVMAAA